MRPKIYKSVHYCEATGLISEMVFHDATSVTQAPSGSNAYPTKDKNGNPLETEFGLSEYRVSQQQGLRVFFPWKERD